MFVNIVSLPWKTLCIRCVRDLWVNGQRVLRNGHHTGAVPGQFVRSD